MELSIYQTHFNKSIVTALLFNNLPLCEKEHKLQLFVNEAEDRYDMFCDNINLLIENKGANSNADTLYLTIDGFSFVSSSLGGQHPSCFPVLTINQNSSFGLDISTLIENALARFAFYCEFIRNTVKSFDRCF